MKKIIPRKTLTAIIPGLICLFALSAFTKVKPPKDKPTPKIVNIVNFIRLLEPRDPAITQGVLYQTVVKQVEIMKKYKPAELFYYNTTP